MVVQVELLHAKPEIMARPEYRDGVPRRLVITLATAKGSVQLTLPLQDAAHLSEVITNALAHGRLCWWDYEEGRWKVKEEL